MCSFTSSNYFTTHKGRCVLWQCGHSPLCWWYECHASFRQQTTSDVKVKQSHQKVRTVFGQLRINVSECSITLAFKRRYHYHNHHPSTSDLSHTHINWKKTMSTTLGSPSTLHIPTRNLSVKKCVKLTNDSGTCTPTAASPPSWTGP
jgi:hypothetical protein